MALWRFRLGIPYWKCILPGTQTTRFLWLFPNLYLGNGCFTKHPCKTGCLGFQVYIRGPSSRGAVLKPYGMVNWPPVTEPFGTPTWRCSLKGVHPNFFTRSRKPLLQEIKWKKSKKYLETRSGEAFLSKQLRNDEFKFHSNLLVHIGLQRHRQVDWWRAGQLVLLLHKNLSSCTTQFFIRLNSNHLHPEKSPHTLLITPGIKQDDSGGFTKIRLRMRSESESPEWLLSDIKESERLSLHSPKLTSFFGLKRKGFVSNPSGSGAIRMSQEFSKWLVTGLFHLLINGVFLEVITHWS